MLTIDQVKSGSPIVILAFGETKEGTIVSVSRSKKRIIYEYEVEGETETRTIWLKAKFAYGGSYYEFAKHSDSDTIFAYFKGWSSPIDQRY
ncbi:MAG: hypothetical protein OXH65_06350 [Paracoccaceae bacterium]|nr:hypothetical protein [Paracoccaceae bacterium]